MRRLVLIALMACICVFALTALQAQEPYDIGQIAPMEQEGRLQFTIALPEFQSLDGSSPIAAGSFRDIISNDLRIDGAFRFPGNPQAVEQIALRDRSQPRISFEQWQQMGVEFVVFGEYRIDQRGTYAQVKLFTTETGDRIFGKAYGPNPDMRLVAHTIADQIIFQLTNRKGISSTKLAFISATGPNKEVHIIDPDGENERPLTSDRSLNATPAWGMNASEIYYTSWKDHNPDLCGVSAFGNDRRTWFISRQRGMNLSPDFCQENQRISLVLGKDGNQEIYSMARNGRDMRRLTFNKAIDDAPSWSPDGRRIAFASDRSGRPQIYIMDADGSNQKRISYANRYNHGPEWSPLGDKIVFTSQEGSGDAFHIYTMNIDGGDLRQLTRGSSNNEEPCWAADGEHIAFSSDRTGKYQVYIMNSDGTNVHQITRRGENTMPVFSPYLH